MIAVVVEGGGRASWVGDARLKDANFVFAHENPTTKTGRGTDHNSIPHTFTNSL